MHVTIKDVARKAGVGIGTVSRVFNRSPLVSQETQMRVLQAAEELGYHPDVSARRLVQGRTRIIAFIERHTPRHLYVDAFMSQVLLGVHTESREAGYHILLEPFTTTDVNGDNRLFQLIREKHADGIIISGPRIDDPIFSTLKDETLPVVLHGNYPGVALPSVDADNFHGARLATQHLIQLGHTRIGMISNGPFEYTAAVARRDGYLAALEEAGLPVDPAIILPGGFSPESGFQAMQILLAAEQRPSAVFVASDTVAVGAIKASRAAGVNLPGDMAMVGFDDIPWAAYLTPPLTTVRLPAQEIGRQAAKLLIQIIDGKSPKNTQRLLPTKLIVRGSSTPA